MNIIAVVFLIAVFLIQAMAEKTRFGIRRSGFFGFIILFMAGAIIFGSALQDSFLQYRLWKSDAVAKFFLPPYQNFDYFIFYARTHFFNSYLLSLFIGLLFLLAGNYFNKKYGERFFEPIEPYLLAASIFVTGHPGWLFYLIILLTLFLIINFSLSIFHFLLNKEIPRTSLYYLWLPAAISIILINRWLIEFLWWQTLKF